MAIKREIWQCHDIMHFRNLILIFPCLRWVSLYFLLLAFAWGNAAAAETVQSVWVHPGPIGKLAYKTTATGDRIMDFSFAGYMGGGVAIPTVPVKATLTPSGNDDTAAIQSA